LGYLDEVWWSRLAQPKLHSWTEAEPLRLVERTAEKGDAEAKALCCYGLLRADTEKIWLRFVQGRPVSGMTTQFLAWVCEQLAREGKKALLLVWDNASWHISQAVRRWIGAHNRQARRKGGVRIIRCQLPTKSPWLNRIEPRWMHGKRAIVEPVRKLTAKELVSRVSEYFGCERLPHISK
jgi:transposase